MIKIVVSVGLVNEVTVAEKAVLLLLESVTIRPIISFGNI